MRLRIGLAVAALVVAALAMPQGAAAHAELIATTPERGARVQAAPERVAFRFNEPVEAGFGAVRVFDAEGERVDEGDPIRPGDDSKAIGVALRSGLPDGSYTATYRVVSADSHPISGGFVFTVGEGGAAPVFQRGRADRGGRRRTCHQRGLRRRASTRIPGYRARCGRSDLPRGGVAAEPARRRPTPGRTGRQPRRPSLPASAVWPAPPSRSASAPLRSASSSRAPTPPAPPSGPRSTPT